MTPLQAVIFFTYINKLLTQTYEIRGYVSGLFGSSSDWKIFFFWKKKNLNNKIQHKIHAIGWIWKSTCHPPIPNNFLVINTTKNNKSSQRINIIKDDISIFFIIIFVRFSKTLDTKILRQIFHTIITFDFIFWLIKTNALTIFSCFVSLKKLY